MPPAFAFRESQELCRTVAYNLDLILIERRTSKDGAVDFFIDRNQLPNIQ